MKLKEDQATLQALLRETIVLLCKNGLQFNKGLSIDALIGITTDDESTFLLKLEETIGDVDTDDTVESEDGDGQSLRGMSKRRSRKRPKVVAHNRNTRKKRRCSNGSMAQSASSQAENFSNQTGDHKNDDDDIYDNNDDDGNDDQNDGDDNVCVDDGALGEQATAGCVKQESTANEQLNSQVDDQYTADVSSVDGSSTSSATNNPAKAPSLQQVRAGRLCIYVVSLCAHSCFLEEVSHF